MSSVSEKLATAEAGHGRSITLVRAWEKPVYSGSGLTYFTITQYEAGREERVVWKSNGYTENQLTGGAPARRARARFRREAEDLTAAFGQSPNQSAELRRE